MSKILTGREMGDIIHKATHDPAIIDDQDQYLRFLTDLAELITDHFGGAHGEATHTHAYNSIGYAVAFDVNECVPDDGGIFKDYDTDVTWKDNKEE